MASGRMIARSLGRSNKYNQLPDHFTKLVYIHALTGADELGRIEADAIAIYGDYFVVDPEASLERIEAALGELHRVGLIQLYEVDGKRYAQFADFDKHNTVRRDKDGNPTREARSRIPDPPTDCAETAQEPRSARTETDPQVEVQDQVQVEVQVEAARERATPPPPTYESSEERMQRRMRGENPNDVHRVRATLRRLAGESFVRDFEGDLESWTRWSDDDLKRLWDASKVTNFPDARKRNAHRSWILADLLREKRTPPAEPKPQPVEPLSGGDLLDYATTLNGSWSN